MEPLGIITLTIILANLIVSYKGFNSTTFFKRYYFRVDDILIRKEYIRLISSGFLHNSWMHFGFNMATLYVFSDSLEQHVGILYYLIIYFASLIGGDLFSLYIHRQHGDYTAVGASGAVCGVIFASIALFPGMELGFPGIEFYLPAWIYGIVFVLVSIYGIKSQAGNIGHEAHLGGALVGLSTAILMEPSALSANYLPILAIVIPSVIFIYLILKQPELLLLHKKSFIRNTPVYNSIDEKYYAEKKSKEEELDRILEKIHQKGMESLSKKEKETLDALSKKVK